MQAAAQRHDPIWYLVHTRARMEAKASVRLKRLGYTTFFAFDRVRRRRKLGTTHIVEWIEKPYFSRYIFAGIMSPKQSIQEIEEQDEVSCVVRRRLSGEPYVISEATFEELTERAMVRFDVDGYCLLMRELVLDADKVVTLYVDEHQHRRMKRELVPAA